MQIIRVFPRRTRATPEQFDTIFDHQNGKCAICGVHESELPHRLAIDHCHATNEVRGLLCDHCNRGLGLFRDSPDFLIKATDYLKSPPCQQSA
jgi:hypothetical protein